MPLELFVDNLDILMVLWKIMKITFGKFVKIITVKIFVEIKDKKFISNLWNVKEKNMIFGTVIENWLKMNVLMKWILLLNVLWLTIINLKFQIQELLDLSQKLVLLPLMELEDWNIIKMVGDQSVIKVWWKNLPKKPVCKWVSISVY
jgi:hypothetical protein